MKFKHVDFTYNYSGQFKGINSYDYIQLAKHSNKESNRKILFVLDYMPSEDMHRGRLLSGATGELLNQLFNVSNQYYGEETEIDDCNWLAITYNAFKTAGETEDFKKAAHKAFTRRIDYVITSYKPDIVVTFGPSPFKAISGNKVSEKFNGVNGHFYGVPITARSTYKGNKHKFKHIPTLSLNTLVNDHGKGDEISLAGYVSRNLVNALHGDLKYSIPKAPKYKPVLVDTIGKFDKMLTYIRHKKRVAIDTETENLNRIKNKMLTIQFASSTKRAFVLPFYHKDSPFTVRELKYIKKKLRSFFEEKNTNKYHVYANAVFDLNVMRQNLGIRFFKNQVWDLFAGEFGHDENMKYLQGIAGHYYYSLLNISMQYGCTAYYDAEFGKDKRKTIVTADLDKALIEYCCLDVIVPLYIMEQQIQRGVDSDYLKYQSLVGEQISDMLHMFSTLEHNGCPTDIEYLFYLKSKQSPLRHLYDMYLNDLGKTKGVDKVNKILAKRCGAPAVGLLGKSNLELFDLSKDEHKQLLFFDALKLKPLSKNAKGGGKIDKKFQAEYSDVPEVAMYNNIGRIKKLMSSYVKAFIKQWGSDDDMRHDRRIRPHFNFLDVVTGRTSAKKPSLHQIPSRSEEGKHIKRVFITEEGRILIKVDYAAHEVRCWSLITGDKDIAKVFAVGGALRDRFKIAPNPELGERIEYEGDVHKINAAYFFGLDIKEVTKTVRNAVKQVIFGLIYQQGFRGLAESTGQTLSAIEKLVGQFKARFPKGVSWFDDVKKSARRDLHVESPVGRRRHLWGFILPKNASKKSESTISRMERLSVNSPVQGLGSDYLVNGSRRIEVLKWEHYKKTGHYPDFYQANSVHDSISVSCAYEDFWLAIRMIEDGLTSEVAKVAKERHNMEFTVPLEIDFEIGSNERDVVAWDYSMEQLRGILKDTLEFQASELGYKVDAKSVYRHITQSQYEHMPVWAKKQCWNEGLQLEGMDVDVRADKEHHTVESIHNKKAA